MRSFVLVYMLIMRRQVVINVLLIGASIALRNPYLVACNIAITPACTIAVFYPIRFGKRTDMLMSLLPFLLMLGGFVGLIMKAGSIAWWAMSAGTVFALWNQAHRLELADPTFSLRINDSAGSIRKSRCLNWPRVWELLGYLLPWKVREKVYEPGHHELLEDYILTNRKYHAKWAKRWLGFCFTLRTLLLVLDCWRVLMADKGIQLLQKMIPEAIRRWWLPPGG